MVHHLPDITLAAGVPARKSDDIAAITMDIETDTEYFDTIFHVCAWVGEVILRPAACELLDGFGRG
jgi:hypothetical protein